MTPSVTDAAEPAGNSFRPITAASRHRPRLVALDGLRFLAALMVVFYHYVGQGGKAWQHHMDSLFPKLDVPASYGFFGVELFFVISGFVICMSSWNRGLGQFFVSRATRLYPAYWLAILATAVLVTLWPAMESRQPPGEVLLNLTMFNGPLNVGYVDPVCWTLWSELRFYLLFAFVVWRGVTYRRVVMFCVLWTVGSLLTSASNEATLEVVFQPEYSPYFIAGVAMYLMYRFRPNLLLWAIVALSWMLAEYRVIDRVHTSEPYVGRPLHWWVASLLITSFFVVVLAVALGWLRWVRGRWITVLGAMTYPLYLLHLIIGWSIIRMLHDRLSPYALLFGLVGAMMLVSWLVYRFVETPIASALRRGLVRAMAEVFGSSRRATDVIPQSRTAPDAESIERPEQQVHQSPARHAKGAIEPTR